MQHNIYFTALLLLLCAGARAQLASPPAAEIHRLDSLYQDLLRANGGNMQAMKHTGYMPFVRLKKFYDDRAFEETASLSKRRLAVYESLLQHQAAARSSQPVADWKDIGPASMETYGGRMISHAFDPVDSKKVWAGSASGGLWRTTNGGNSWQSMTDLLPSTGVGAIAIKPDNPDVLLIGTGEGTIPTYLSVKGGIGIFKSTDGGKSWEATSFAYDLKKDVSVMKLVWHPTQHNILYAGATNGMWKSEDEGQTWKLIAGTGSNHTTYVCNDIILDAKDPNILYYAIEGNGIFKSLNGGASAVKLTNGLPTTDVNYIRMSQCAGANQVLYASIIAAGNSGLKGLYRTDDGGDHWTKLVNAPQAPCSPDFVGLCSGWYANFVCVSPVDPEHVFLGGITMWESRDGGTSWIQKDRLQCDNCADPPPCTMYGDHHDMGFSPHNPNLIYNFSDGGVAVSRNGGGCFEDKNQDLGTGQFYAIASARTDPNIVSGGFQDHGLQAVDIRQGRNWTRWSWLDGADCVIHPQDAGIFYGTWIDGSYWKYEKNGGRYAYPIMSGIDINENNGFYFAPICIDPKNGDVLLGATKQKLYRTDDGGLNWTPVFTTSVLSDFSFSEADSRYAYAASWVTSASSRILRSEDNGLTWKPALKNPGGLITDLKTSAQHPLTLFVSRNNPAANKPHVFKSTDGGDSWTPIQGDLPDVFVNCLAVDLFNDNIVYAGTDLGVFITTNGGINWTPFNEGMPITYIYDLDFNPTDTSLVTGTYGRGAWKTKAFVPEVTGTVDVAHAEKGFALSPNPTRDLVRITVPDRSGEHLDLSILNGYGQVVHQIFKDRAEADDLRLSFSCKQLNIGAGHYYVRLISEGYSAVQKLVVVNG